MSVQKLVLEYLMSHQNQPISGQALADEFSVSRNAVWKAIEILRQKGYQIVSQGNTGYQLKGMSHQLDPEQILHQIDEMWEGLYIENHKEVTSTNDLAKQFNITNRGQNGLFIAEKQTQGRGRRGRNFHSDLSKGLYFSLTIRPKVDDPQDVPRYTIAAATAVVQAIEALTDKDIKIKWVNDLFYNGRKISGILSEAVTDLETGGFSAIVIGIGINLSGDFSAASQDVQDVAGTLFGESLRESFNPNQFLKTFLNYFGRYHLDLLAPDFLSIYRDHLLGLNQEVTYLINKEKHRGIIEGIDTDGHLLVRQTNGQLETLIGQEVHFSSKQFAQQADTQEDTQDEN